MVVGVPLMAPVDVLKERPVGSDGEIGRDVAAPPLLPGVIVLMAEPLVSVGNSDCS